ncbi:MAG: hypothetical protein ABSG65_18145 [Bryobacteraceae bacterium]|jgi:hypothetical protein
MSCIAPLAILVVFATATSAQTVQAPHVQEGGATAYTRDGGVSEVLQSIYIPPLLNAPFSAIVHTEWTRPMPGGGNFTFVNQRQVARDSRGRIYEERWLLAPKGSEDKSRMNVIQIADPNAQTLYNCFTLQTPHRCVLQTFAETAVKSYKPAVFRTGPLPNDAGTRVIEDLGARTIAGIETVGTRDTSNMNAGVMGSDQPFSTWREFWQAPQIGVNLYSEVVNPSVGKQVFTLTDVNLAEPDPKLFELPDGFDVVDRRKPVAQHPE